MEGEMVWHSRKKKDGGGAVSFACLLAPNDLFIVAALDAHATNRNTNGLDACRGRIVLFHCALNFLGSCVHGQGRLLTQGITLELFYRIINWITG